MKVIRVFQSAVCAALLLVWGFLLFGFFFVPDSIVSVTDEVPTRAGVYSIQTVSTQGVQTDAPKQTVPVQVKFLGAFPVKTGTLQVTPRQYVVVSGEIFGLRLYTSGVVIVSTEKVQTPQGEVSPAERAGLKKGDVLLEVNGEPVRSHTELSALLSENLGAPMQLTILRNGEEKQTSFAPAYSVTQEKYMAGLWVRDSAAGIGTMTFYDPATGFYAGLGHAVCDVDTGEVLPLYNGDIVAATVTGCYKGTRGQAGELCGSFHTQSLGTLERNDDDGVYGWLVTTPADGERVPVALPNEVHTGKAQLIATVDENGPAAYDVEIEKLSPDDPKGRNMIVRVTDARLLEKTGGIVQGMSGSPLMQDGALVGAVTHVFVNEPQRGYAIFSEIMMEKAKSLAQSTEKLAS